MQFIENTQYNKGGENEIKYPKAKHQTNTNSKAYTDLTIAPQYGGVLRIANTYVLPPGWVFPVG